MDGNIPSISVIIVNYNGGAYLENCLKSLFGTDYGKFEVIIVDNNSSDNSIEMVEAHYPRCKIVRLQENRGFAIANNIGATHSTGEYLAFLNNDTVTTTTWLKELISVMQTDKSIAIAQSLLLKLDDKDIVDSSGDFVTQYGRTYNSKRREFSAPREVLSARAAAMVIRKQLFDNLGGFDEDYFISFEDVEIGWKAWILNYRVVMVPGSIVYHKGGSTSSRMSSLITFHGLKNQLSLITTHFETGLALRNIVFVLFTLLGAFLALIFHIGTRKQSFTVDKKAAVKAVVWYFQNFRSIWRKHSRLNSVRSRSTRELRNMGLVTDKVDDK